MFLIIDCEGSLMKVYIDMERVECLIHTRDLVPNVRGYPLGSQAVNIQDKSDINLSDTEEEKTMKYENLALEI